MHLAVTFVNLRFPVVLPRVSIVGGGHSCPDRAGHEVAGDRRAVDAARNASQCAKPGCGAGVGVGTVGEPLQLHDSQSSRAGTGIQKNLDGAMHGPP
jgi:hypothetical protein